MPRLIYNDDNKDLLDSSSAGAKGKGVIYLVISPILFVIGISLPVLFVAGLVSGDVSSSIIGLIVSFLFLAFMVLLILAISFILFMGGIYGISIRNFRIFDDHLELSSFWRRIERKDLLEIIGDHDQLINREDEIIRMNKEKSILMKAWNGQEMFKALEKNMLKGEIILLVHKKKDFGKTFEVISKEEHRNLLMIREVLKGLIISTAEAERRSKKIINGDRTLKIVPALNNELRNRFKRIYIPMISSVTIIWFIFNITLIIIGMPLIGLPLMAIWLLYLGFNLVCLLFLIPANRNCTYELQENMIVIHNQASMMRFEIEYSNIEKVMRLNSEPYGKFSKYMGLRGRDRLVVIAYMLKNMYTVTLKEPIKPITSFGETREIKMVILGDDEEWTGYRVIKKRSVG